MGTNLSYNYMKVLHLICSSCLMLALILSRTSTNLQRPILPWNNQVLANYPWAHDENNTPNEQIMSAICYGNTESVSKRSEKTASPLALARRIWRGRLRERESKICDFEGPVWCGRNLRESSVEGQRRGSCGRGGACPRFEESGEKRRRSYGEVRGSWNEQNAQGMADMDSQEGQDVHALRLHSSHHYHRYEHRSEAAALAVAQSCLICLVLWPHAWWRFEWRGFRSFSRPPSEDASELLLGIFWEIFTDIFGVKRSP